MRHTRKAIEISPLQKMSMLARENADYSAAATPDGGDLEHSAIFWGEIAPCEHLVQIYNNDATFLDALEGFIAGGIRSGDGIIVIATPEHRAALEHRLDARGIDVHAAKLREQYLSLDASHVLSNFMVTLAGMQWPDKDRFERAINDLLAQAAKRPDGGQRRVRAFGEMVALLWKEGHTSATVRLEYLWHELCQQKAFSLFCAYPRAFFTQSAQESMEQICRAHSRVVPG